MVMKSPQEIEAVFLDPKSELRESIVRFLGTMSFLVTH